MKLFIVGSTGKTGLQLIKQGLDHGHIITALARDPKKLKLSHPNLRVVKGDVLLPETFEKEIEGQDAVLSALGHKKWIVKTDILSKGTKNIITAMEKYNVQRFLCITSLGINDSKYRLGLYYTLFVIPVLLYFYFKDKEKQEKLIMASSLDWTIVRPGQLLDSSKRKRYKHGMNLGSYILTKMISRSNVAHFMLTQINERTYMRQTPGITY